jgi:hypothetical protein
MVGYEDVLGLATSQNWLNLGVTLVISTIVGGIIVAIILAIASKSWGTPIKIQNSFLLVLVINAINFFGILAFVTPYLGGMALILPVLIWILLTKAFFSEMRWLHALIIGIIGFAVSILVIPMIVGWVAGFMPSFNY